MLEIHEKFSTEGYEKLAAKSNDNLHITEAFDKDNVIGFIAYSYESDRTIIHDLDDGSDLYLCDGLVRSVLFKSCLKDIHTAEFAVDDEGKIKRLEKLGFIKDNSRILENIDSFMNGCQNCRNNPNKDKNI